MIWERILMVPRKYSVFCDTFKNVSLKKNKVHVTAHRYILRQ